MARQFQDVWRALDISYDDFIQTSEPRHHAGCRKFIQAVFDAGDIYKGVYQGHYCNGCEAFKTEKEVEEGNGRCPNHPTTPLVWLEENNYFFRLSAYRERLLAHYAAHPDFIQPESRRNEVINLVETELRDIAITRKGFAWGIKVPFDAEQTIYVWFDALLNYITGIGYGTDDERFQQIWPAERARHRQGHHAVSLRALAGHADVGRRAVARARLRARLRLPQERRDGRSAEAQQEPGQRRRADGADREVLGRGIPLLLHEPVPVRRRRRVFVRALRRHVQQRPGQQPRQPLQPHPDDVPQVLRRPARGRGQRRCDRMATRARSRPRWSPTCARSIGSFDYSAAHCSGSGATSSTRPTGTSRRPSRSSWPRPISTRCRAVLVNLAEWLRVAAILIKPFLPRTAETFYRAFNFEEARGVGPGQLSAMRHRRCCRPSLQVTAPITGGKPAPLFPKIESR